LKEGSSATDSLSSDANGCNGGLFGNKHAIRMPTDVTEVRNYESGIRKREESRGKKQEARRKIP
jgi:hypothetical protein